MAGPVTIRGTNNPDAATGVTAISVDKPAGTVNGDLILVQIEVWHAAPGSVTVTPPAGFQSVPGGSVLSSAFTRRAALYWKIANNEPASWQFGFSTTVDARESAISYSDTDRVAPIEAVAVTATSTASTSMTFPNVTTLSFDAKVLCWASTESNTISGGFYGPVTFPGAEHRHDDGILLADRFDTVTPGPYSIPTISGNAASSTYVLWTIAIREPQVQAVPFVQQSLTVALNGRDLSAEQLDANRQLGSPLTRHEFSMADNVAGGALDAGVTRAADLGIKILPLFGYGGTYPNITQAAQRCADLATRYGPGGTFWDANPQYAASLHMTHLEVGNESSYPNHVGTFNDPETYAELVKAIGIAVKAANPGVGLLVQADDAAQPNNWINRLFVQVPNLADYAAGWTLHAYGPPQNRLKKRMRDIDEKVRPHSTAPVWLTEYGFASCERSNGTVKTLDDNFGWPTNMDYAQAAVELADVLGYIQAQWAHRADNPLKVVLYYQSTDQFARDDASTDRDRYFGLMDWDTYGSWRPKDGLFSLFTTLAATGGAMGSYLVQLGRLRLPTLMEGAKEALGDGFDTVGAVAVPGDRKARPFDLTIPVRGDREPDPRDVGQRLRRQVRALLENAPARLEGLWFTFSPDPELDMLLFVGGGDLSYTDAGIVFGDYELALSDVFKAGSVRTHRPARRLDSPDRRLSTTPRDIRRTIYSTDFALLPALSVAALPVGAADLVASGGKVVVFNSRSSLHGLFPIVIDRPHGDVVSFERSAPDDGKADVLVLDRQDNPSPLFTLAGDQDPVGVYGWEEVYGTDQPLTPGDVPVVENGLCRARWIATTSSLAVDQFVSGTGYVERGRVTVWRDFPADTLARYDQLVGVTVAEWTPERAVIRVTLVQSTSVGDRVEMYVTLQRGWTGPRIEAYPAWAVAGAPGAAMFYSPADANARIAVRGGSAPAVSTVEGAWPLIVGDFAAPAEPWAMLAREDGTGPTVTVAVVRAGVRLRTLDESFAYGTTRKAVGIAAPHGTTVAGYCSITIGHAPPSRALEAEAHRYAGSGTTSQQADAAAVGGQAVQDTQTAEIDDTLTIPAATLDSFGLAPATYGVWVRIRATAADGELSMRARFSVGPGTGVVATTPGTSYVWFYAGEAPRSTGQDFNFRLSRSGGTGNARIDRLLLVPLERRDLADQFDGARDHGQANLRDTRTTPILVAR